jgi:bisphosphoglycerate-independent phosphoglycerate mutase (AlkP superfamily)
MANEYSLTSIYEEAQYNRVWPERIYLAFRNDGDRIIFDAYRNDGAEIIEFFENDCKDQFGPKGIRWYHMTNSALFEFKSKADAMLFKLTVENTTLEAE